MGLDTFWTIALLIASNCFMTAAWYGHLKFKSAPLWLAIVASWGIAFFEYVLQVPANRIGSSSLSASQLKILQEAIALVVFIGFTRFYFNEVLTVRHAISFTLVLAAVAVLFH